MLVLETTRSGPVTLRAELVNVDQADSDVSNNVASMTQTAPPAPQPPNDDVATAVDLTGPTGTVASTTVGATAERFEGRDRASVWYRWQAPATGVLKLNIPQEEPTRKSNSTRAPRPRLQPVPELLLWTLLPLQLWGSSRSRSHVYDCGEPSSACGRTSTSNGTSARRRRMTISPMQRRSQRGLARFLRAPSVQRLNQASRCPS